MTIDFKCRTTHGAIGHIGKSMAEEVACCGYWLTAVGCSEVKAWKAVE